MQLIHLGLLLALLLIAAASWKTTHVPWLGIGIDFQPGRNYLEIRQVHENGPSVGKLRAGDRILAFSNGRERVEVSPLLNYLDIANFSTFEAINAFLAEQSRVWAVLDDRRVILELPDRTVSIEPAPRRPLGSYSFSGYWMLILTGLAALVIGMYIWVFRRQERATQILFIAGAGFFLCAVSTAILLFRELVFDGREFFVIFSIGQVGIILFGMSTVVLMWNYPRPLSSFPATRYFYLAAVLIWVNQSFQLVELPLHSTFVHFFVEFLLLLIFAGLQWRASRDRVLERAALQLLLLSMIISIGITLLLYFLPTFFGRQPLIAITEAFLLGLLVFVGLILGIQRYKLFNLSRWWFETWSWLLIFMFAFAMDGALIYLMDLSSNAAFAVSIIILVWIYLPVRYALQKYLLSGRRRNLERYIPYLLESIIISETTESFSRNWKKVLEHVFSPLEIEFTGESTQQSKLEEQGVELHVPHIENGDTLVLKFKESGKSLFTPEDCQLADSLLELARTSLRIKHNHEQEVDNERKRIGRDLHDDVAAQILTLIHKTSESEIARRSKQVLESIRTTIYSLDSSAEVPVGETLSELYQQINERLGESSHELKWKVKVDDYEASLKPRQNINLKRIFSEAVSNIIKHAGATKVCVEIGLQGGRFWFRISDDGVCRDPASWLAGKGLNNIRIRMKEINGEVKWQRNESTEQQSGCNLRGEFRLGEEHA